MSRPLVAEINSGIANSGSTSASSVKVFLSVNTISMDGLEK